MSNFALTVPGKWNSYNSSTVHHVMTRHSSFKSPRYETSKQSSSHAVDDESLTEKNKISKKSIEDKYPLLHLRDGESSNDRNVQTNTLSLPKLVGKQSVLNKVYTAGGQRTAEEKETDNYTTNSLEIRMPGSLADSLNEYKLRLKKVETEKKELQKQINALYGENKSLRMSIDSADQPGIDSYRQVLQDRSLLRDAEDNYKKRIAKLEKDLKDVHKTCQNLTEEKKKLKEGSDRHVEKLENQSKYNNLYWKWNALKKENETLHKDIAVLMKFGSKSNVHLLLGRGLKELDPVANSKPSGKHQYNSVFEERNALKIENRKLKEDIEKLKKQMDQQKEESESQSDDKNLQSGINGYQKMYYESDKKAELYKRIMQLEHENTYLSLSNNNLLRELRDLQAKYNKE